MKTTSFLIGGAGIGAYHAGYLTPLILGVAIAALCLIIGKPGAITRWRIRRLEDALIELDLKRERLANQKASYCQTARESDDDVERRATLASLVACRRRVTQLNRHVSRLERRADRLRASLCRCPTAPHPFLDH